MYLDLPFMFLGAGGGNYAGSLLERKVGRKSSGKKALVASPGLIRPMAKGKG